MIVRCVGRDALRCCTRRFPRSQARVRKYSTPSSITSTSSAPASPLGVLTSELDRIAPRFEIDASRIQILDSPNLFYETLKVRTTTILRTHYWQLTKSQTKILQARRRIYFSTLYIGKTEHELIATLDQALRKNSELKVSILTDALRGTREAPDPSCASLLASLVAEHGSDRVQIRMFHTPNLTGLRKKYVPKRINEGWGLQHMKLYGIDDEIILSGCEMLRSATDNFDILIIIRANLSNDYFTNRLDRYHVFSSAKLAEYFARIHGAVCSLSFQVLPDAKSAAGYLLHWPTENGFVSPLDDPDKFISQSTQVLRPLIQPSKLTQNTQPPKAPKTTFVYPLAQFTPLLRPDTSTEFPVMTTVLSRLSTSPALVNSNWVFTAGYFNIHPQISSLLIASARASAQKNCTVVTASPWANGFYGSAGVSGMLPAAYTLLSRRFLAAAEKASRSSSIELKEWRRGTVGEPGGWTYHAKGLWISAPDEKDPCVTLVGSSNYTKRSYSLDLEIGAVVVTEDPALKQKLREETEWLQRDAEVTTMDDLRKVERRVGWRVRVAMWIVEKVGGAL